MQSRETQQKATQPESRQDGRRQSLSRKLQHSRCESALPDPLELKSSAKSLNDLLPEDVPNTFLNDNDRRLQRQIIRSDKLTYTRPSCPPPGLACWRARRQAPAGIQYATAFRLKH